MKSSWSFKEICVRRWWFQMEYVRRTRRTSCNCELVRDADWIVGFGSRGKSSRLTIWKIWKIWKTPNMVPWSQTQHVNVSNFVLWGQKRVLQALEKEAADCFTDWKMASESHRDKKPCGGDQVTKSVGSSHAMRRLDFGSSVVQLNLCYQSMSWQISNQFNSLISLGVGLTLVGGFKHFLFAIIYGIILPIG